MSKGIIVVDMPTSCIGCRFQDMEFCLALHDGGEMIPDYMLDEKPSWCPIKECKEMQNEILGSLIEKIEDKTIKDKSIGRIQCEGVAKAIRIIMEEME